MTISLSREECKKCKEYIDEYVYAIRTFKEAQTAMNNASDNLRETLYMTPIWFKIDEVNNQIEDCINEVAKEIGKAVVAIKDAERNNYEQ